MASPPKSVVHINFIAGALLFDPRHIWTALNEAALAGKMPPSLPQELGARLGAAAIHLGTREGLAGWMTPAVTESRAARLLCLDASNEEALYFLKMGLPRDRPGTVIILRGFGFLMPAGASLRSPNRV